MAHLTVHDVDDELVRRLRVRAAAHRRSVEAEHRAILHSALYEEENRTLARLQAISRLAEFRHRIAGSGSASVAELIAESQAYRMKTLTGWSESDGALAHDRQVD